MKRQKEQEELAAKKAREEKLATMDEEEKAAFLKAEEDKLNHQKKARSNAATADENV